jgi:hypothetical protein
MKHAAMQVVEQTRLADLNFYPGDGSAQRARVIKRLVERERDLRSGRSFGFRRCKNEFVQGVQSYRDGWFYDTFSVAAGAAFITQLMFALPQSGTKLLNSTNLTGQGGQLPAGTTLMVGAIRVSISGTTVPADVQNIFTNVTFEFKVNNVPIYQATPDYFPAGFGAPTFSAAQLGTAPSGTATLTSITNGMPVQTAIYEFKNPYSLSSLENFVIVLTPQVAFNMVAATGVNPLGVGTTIRVYLDGMKNQIVTG